MRPRNFCSHFNVSTYGGTGPIWRFRFSSKQIKKYRTQSNVIPSFYYPAVTVKTNEITTEEIKPRDFLVRSNVQLFSLGNILLTKNCIFLVLYRKCQGRIAHAHFLRNFPFLILVVFCVCVPCLGYPFFFILFGFSSFCFVFLFHFILRSYYAACIIPLFMPFIAECAGVSRPQLLRKCYTERCFSSSSIAHYTTTCWPSLFSFSLNQFPISKDALFPLNS